MLTLNKRFTSLYLSVFLALEILLGILIQFSSNTTYSILTLLSIILCFITVSIFFKHTFVHLLTLVALFNTVCADFFLCGLVDFKSIKFVAMVFFSITQLCYFLRIYSTQKYNSQKRFHLFCRILLPVFALILTVLILKENTNALALITIFYYSNLIINVVFSFLQFKRAPLFAIGLLFFSLCDLFIGFEFLGDFLSISENSIITKINDIDLNLAWIFYVPSQTLIATDSIINEKDC